MNSAKPNEMKNWRNKIFIILIITMMLFLLMIPASADEGGLGDGYVDGIDCISCHDTDNNLGLGAGHKSISIGSSKPKITIQVNVDLTLVPSPSQTYGVMLLSKNYGNLSEDGWIIISDPRENPIPKNYIERDKSNTTLMEWHVDNVPGSYTIKVVVVYGSNSIESFEEIDVKFTIGQPEGNNPPQLSSPKAIVLSDERTYDFEITYIDPEGEYPRNITVNISNVGTFEMLPRTQPPHDFKEGVTYYHLTTLPEARYSYHFAASDGNSWNRSENSFFYTGEREADDIDYSPLLFGIIIGVIVIGGIYVLRGKKQRERFI